MSDLLCFSLVFLSSVSPLRVSENALYHFCGLVSFMFVLCSCLRCADWCGRLHVHLMSSSALCLFVFWCALCYFCFWFAVWSFCALVYLCPRLLDGRSMLPFAFHLFCVSICFISVLSSGLLYVRSVLSYKNFMELLSCRTHEMWCFMELPRTFANPGILFQTQT